MRRPAAPLAAVARQASTVSAPAAGERPGFEAVAVAGPPGSGKSTFALAFARAGGHVLLDLDDVAGSLTAAALALVGAGEEAVDDPGIGAVLRGARYEALERTAVANLRIGRTVVLVAPFTVERRDPGAWASLASRLGTTPLLCDVAAPPEVCRARIARRAAPRDAAKVAAPDRFSGGESFRATLVDHVRVDGTAPVAGEVERVLAIVSLHAGEDAGGGPTSC